MRILNVAAGVLLIAAGIYCLCNQDVALLSAGLLLGIFLLLSGVAEIVVFAAASGVMLGSGWLLLDGSAGHISNKTLYIALNYEEQAERMNAESAHEIAKELFALECEQRRLTYFIGLLDKRQAEVIRLVFVDGIPTKEVAASFGLTYRTIDRIKRTAIENLAEMYAYSDQFRV